MNMSKQEKEVNLAVFRRRHAAMRTVKARGATLDAYCGITGHTRKHAIKTLSPKRKPPGGMREATALLVKLWRLSDMLYGKLLKPVIELYLENLRRRDGIPDDAAEVLRMSASTTDRRQRPSRCHPI